jgi:hypothetical protein
MKILDDYSFFLTRSGKDAQGVIRPLHDNPAVVEVLQRIKDALRSGAAVKEYISLVGKLELFHGATVSRKTQVV